MSVIRALLLCINCAFLEQNDLLAKFVLNVFMPLPSSWYQRTWREGLVPDTEMLIRPPHMGLQSWSWHLLELLATKLAFWASEILGIMTSFLPSWWDCQSFKAADGEVLGKVQSLTQHEIIFTRAASMASTLSWWWWCLLYSFWWWCLLYS